MIIACPHCGTSYAVEADVFGPEARTVECSACGGRWQQAPAAHAEPVAPAMAAAAVDAPIVASAGAPDVSPERVDPGEAFAQPPVSGRIEADRVAELPGEESPDDVASSAALPSDRPPSQEDRIDPAPSVSDDTATAEPGGVRTTGIPDETAPEADDPNETAAVPTQPRTTPASCAPPAGLDVKRGVKRGAGKARAAQQMLRRMRKHLTVGGIAAAAALCALTALAIVLREPVVSILPAAAGVYDAVGLAPDPIGDGLEIRNVISTRAREGGADVLTISGVVTNVSASERALPPLSVSLWNASDEEVRSATVRHSRNRLAPGEAFPFESRIPEPPPEARSLRVGFAQPTS